MPPPSLQQNTAKTIAATAVITLVIVGLAILIFRKIVKFRWKNKINSSFRREETIVTHEEFEKFEARAKGLIVDENRQEGLYMRKLKDGELKASFPQIVFNPSYEEEDEEKGMDVTVHRKTKPHLLLNEASDLPGHKKKAEPVLQNQTPLPPVSIPLQKQPPPPPPASAKRVPVSLPPAPPPPLNHSLQVLPPPPPPPISVKRNTMPSFPPPRALNLVSPLKPAPTARGKADQNREGGPAEESSKRTVVGQVKLKPLHWDKVVTNVEQSMVWNEIKDKSLR